VIDELGLFETMRVVRGRVVQLEEHFQRMSASAEALAFPLPERAVFDRIIRNASRRVAGVSEAALRCIHAALDGHDWRLTATAAPISDITLRRRRRGRAITLAHARALPQHKMTAYAASTIGLREALRRNADEGLFLDAEGNVLEGTATNVFAVSGSVLVTAPIAAGILPGTVRAWILREAPALGLTVVERAPGVEELRAGGFLTSSLTTIAPIRFVNGETCAAVPEVVRELRSRYLRITS
jgi:branched-subunit amino acid aminotransferase/4-amino-4-deoxychorismate lyase